MFVHVLRNEHRVDILTKALGRIKFKEMRNLIGVQDFSKNEFKIKEKNVRLSLKETYGASYRPNPVKILKLRIRICLELSEYVT